MKTNTRIDRLVPWHPDYAAESPLFAPIRDLANRFTAFEQWPGLADFQALLDSLPEPIRTERGAELKVVEQEGRPERFEHHYAPRIYLSGEIQTRRENWHDMFQLFSWILFPRTKAVINAIHIPKAQARIEAGEELGRRTPIENMLSLFDEGGAVVVSSNPELLQLIRDFEWKELFWQRRAEVEQQLDCVVFGHAMYEKGLAPYLGMTANAILLEVGEEYFEWQLPQRLDWIDGALAEIFRRGERYQRPRDLQPFPILGMPDWDPANAAEGYYDNRDYFRPGRRRG